MNVSETIRDSVNRLPEPEPILAKGEPETKIVSIETIQRRPETVAVSDGLSKEMQQAIYWLRKNPDHGLSLAQAGRLAGVSKATMGRATNRLHPKPQKEEES